MRLPDQSVPLLADLYFQYVERTPARRAIRRHDKRVRAGSIKSLDALLRHHDEDGISSEETYLRDEFDYLIEFFGLVEIGCVCAALPVELPSTFAADALLYLEHPSIKKYYSTHYPLILPQRLRRRLRGERMVVAEMPKSQSDLFDRFLEVSNPILMGADKELERFLWLLDGGSVIDGKGEWADLDDLLSTIKRPRSFVRSLSLSPRRRSELDMALHGFGTFIHFCARFNGFLEQFSNLPIVQTAFWLAHEYWFSHLRSEVGESVRRAAVAFSQWSQRAQGDEASAAMDPVVLTAVRLLTGSTYARGLT